MSVADFADLSGFRTFRLTKPELMKEASPAGLCSDFLRNCPVFVFVHSREIAREYLFGIFGYLDFAGYPVFWYGQELSREQRARRVILADASWHGPESPDIILAPGAQGKMRMWQKIAPYADRLRNLNPEGAAARSAGIILDSPGSDARILTNLAGFLNYYGIAYSWKPEKADKDGVFVGRSAREGLDFVQVSGATDEEKKKTVYQGLLGKGYLVRNQDGTFSGRKR